MENTPISPAPQSVPPVQFTPTEASGQYAPQSVPPTRSHGPVIAAVVVGILVLAGAVFAYTKLASKPVETASPTPSAYGLPTASTLPPTASPMASATPDPTAGWKTYTSTQYGYQFKYPTGFSVVPTNTSGDPTCGNIELGVCAIMSQEYHNANYPGTNLAGAGFAVRILDTAGTNFNSEAGCNSYGGYYGSPKSSEHLTETIVVNGATFFHAETPGGAAAGTVTTGTFYRTFHGGKCWELFTGKSSTGTGADFGGAKPFTPAQTQSFNALLNGFLNSFTFTNPATAGWKTYTNTQYGFELTLTDSWSGYKVFSSEGSQGVGAPTYLQFSLPTTDKSQSVTSGTESVSGYAAPLTITVIAKDRNYQGTGTKITSDADYTYYSTINTNLPSDLKSINFEIPKVLSTFKLTQ